jgi:hypothetical protein
MNIWDEVPRSVLDFAYKHAETDHVLVYRLNKAKASGSRLQAWWMQLRLRMRPSVNARLLKKYGNTYSEDQIDRISAYARQASR